MRLRFHFVLLLSMAFSTVFGQSESENKSVFVKETQIPVVLDGELDDPAWQDADRAGDFWQNFPYDSSKALTQTEVMFSYDKTFLYVGAILHDPIEGEFIIKSLRRDFQGPEIDGFHIMLDTFEDRINAFNFSVNPYGVQREGLVTNGGNQRTDLSWDNKWFSEVKVHDGYWVAEMAIPFKTIRYKKGSDHWHFQSLRLDGKQNERSSWMRVPRGFSLASLAFAGDLYFDKPLEKSGPNIALIPYVAADYSEDREEGEEGEFNFNAGGDAKITITPSLNLDVTINPDFSQVEVDQQQTNLTRFELFFPEKRQFFLENADLFADFGGRSTRPFFSRRIGLAEDSTTGQPIQNRIYYGLRLSGKIDNNWRIGLLNMQTERVKESGLPAYNFGMAVVQRKVMSNSNASVFVVNKQPWLNNEEDDYSESLDRYNRVAGGEFDYRSRNGKWSGNVFYHRSFTEQDTLQGEFATGAFLRYRSPEWDIFGGFREVGRDYEAEVGFVPRKDFKRIFTRADKWFYPKSGIINRHGPGGAAEHIWTNEFSKTDQNFRAQYTVRFQDQSSFQVGVDYRYTYLFDDFDPSGVDGIPLPEGTEYNYTSLVWQYESNLRKRFFLTFRGRYGSFFNGKRLNFQGNINYRLQPIAIFSIDYTYNKLDFPSPQTSTNLYLIGPRLDFTFTRDLFFTTVVQYNNQIDNINVNARFQWRYKPVSDLFIVYTDNYFATNPYLFNNKNRALIIKLTYWLNL